jgi:cation transport regulator ChaC
MAATAEPKVWVFFYGSYINFDVLKEVGLVPGEWEVARLPGFDIRIAPRANLIRSERDTVWGINATATHAELERLYAHAKGVLGETYLPEAAVTSTKDGRLRPVMTYICPEMVVRPAEAAYVDRIAAPARKFGFPRWYVERIEAFRI